MSGQNDVDHWLKTVKDGVQKLGDIHGQFHDLLELFNKGGEIPNTRYIFMGDFVDRGYNSRTFQLLLCLKLKYPAHITLLRGNHETRQITTVYGFYDETIRKYGNANPWKYLLCVQQITIGGLSPDIKTISEMKIILRSYVKYMLDCIITCDGRIQILVQILKAPNYCYRCGNVASILNINEKLERSFDIFHAVTESSRVVPYRNVVPYFL